MKTKYTREDRFLVVPPQYRKAVFERDKVCRICGSDVGLEVHHIDPYMDPALRSSPENLCLLCRLCHRAVTIIQRRFPSIYFKYIAPRLCDPNDLWRLYVLHAVEVAKKYKGESK